MMRLMDETAATVDALASELSESRGFRYICAAVRAAHCRGLGEDDDPATDAITMLVPFYRAIETSRPGSGGSIRIIRPN